MPRRHHASRWVLLASCVGVSLRLSAASAEEIPPPSEDAVPAIYLVAARQKPRIADSLQRGGVRVVEDLLDSPLLLRVTVGNEKGYRSCGTRNNVKYALYVDGVKTLELSDEGWTGSCEPNVFDAMSAELARALPKATGGRAR